MPRRIAHEFAVRYVTDIAPPKGELHVPQYSPDGKEIAYVSWDSGNPEIWICDSDGSNPLQLTHLGGPEPASPHWSPNGQQIVFSMTPAGVDGWKEPVLPEGGEGLCQ
jgi:Tol biopolymer transport system component